MSISLISRRALVLRSSHPQRVFVSSFSTTPKSNDIVGKVQEAAQSVNKKAGELASKSVENLQAASNKVRTLLVRSPVKLATLLLMRRTRPTRLKNLRKIWLKTLRRKYKFNRVVSFLHLIILGVVQFLLGMRSPDPMGFGVHPGMEFPHNSTRVNVE
ncbi:hypothetical protein KEM48_007909 [Puccinia striiformis f. sp. tritici PST-130]|nr:hypothetical protein KEM48_007909 [Puccinia striiformis f. sp. tritici PST-130]